MTVGGPQGNGRHTSVPESTGLQSNGAPLGGVGQSASVAQAMRHCPPRPHARPTPQLASAVHVMFGMQ
jgi:hypothetical protein